MQIGGEGLAAVAGELDPNEHPFTRHLMRDRLPAGVAAPLDQDGVDSLAGDAVAAVLRKGRDEVEAGDEAADPSEITLALVSPRACRSALGPAVTRVTSLTAKSSPSIAAGISASHSARRAATTAVEWLTIFAVVGALYNLREWSGKGRRYRNQRRRVANELLRVDLRRSFSF
jgi:hypothetical protein